MKKKKARRRHRDARASGGGQAQQTSPKKKTAASRASVTAESAGPRPPKRARQIAANPGSAPTAPQRRELYPAIEPFRHGYLRVSEFMKSTMKNAATRPASRPSSCTAARRRLRQARAAILRPAALPHRGVRSARLRPQPAERQPGREYDLASGRRHRTIAQAPQHRALAGVRRIMGQHPGAGLCGGQSRARQRNRAARDFPAALCRDPLVLSARRLGDISRRLGELPRRHSAR
jgi:hypothetical protein